ncbi:MAG: carbamate kinase [Oligoflexia bacterium]|nr:carbamate kinase [Oligoflexia bacterium]
MRGINVVALGGNSLLDPSRPPTVANQFSHAQRSMGPVAELIQRGENLVLTHGNGPQVGFMVLRAELAAPEVHQVPLDSLVADTQGALGYMIQRVLRQELRRRGDKTDIVALVTEVDVDPKDPAFSRPTKPIGQFYSQAEAQKLAAQRGWQIIEDAGRGWRRVVPSPSPIDIVQIDVIRHLIDDGVVVVCCGGGGIPVFLDDHGHEVGVEAVIDKDRVSALLAVKLGAQRLFVTTGVEGIFVDYQTDRRRLLHTVTVDELDELAAQGQFPPGSMGPKVEAARTFLAAPTSIETVVCHPRDLVAAFDGHAGTRVTRQ